MEKKIGNLIWSINDVLRGYHRPGEMFEVFVTVIFFHFISKKYGILIQKGKMMKSHIKESEIIKDEFEVLEYFESLPYLSSFKKEDIDKIFTMLDDVDSNYYGEIIRELIRQDSYELGETTTNLYLSSLSRRLLGDLNGSFADFCSGYGIFILDSHLKGNDYNIVDSYELNERTCYFQKAIAIFVRSNTNVFNKNILTENIEVKYDAIFSAPPFGLRVQRQIIEQSIASGGSLIKNYLHANSTEWLFINKILGSLKNSGRSVVLVSNGTLFKTIDEKIRETIIEEKFLEGVINLSDGLLGKYTSIPLSVLILNKHSNEFVRMVDASNIFSQERMNKYLSENDIDDILEMYYSEESKMSFGNLRENNYSLMKSRYQFMGELDNFIAIKDIIKDLFRGIQISSRDYGSKIVPEGTKDSINLLSSGNISKYFIDANPEVINPEGIRYERYVLEDGDFIITAKGSKVKTAIFDKSIIKGVTVPLGSVMVLRIDKDKYNPYFLKVFLASPLGLKLLELAQTGNTIVSLNRKNLEELKIPNVSLKKQKESVVDYLVYRDSYAYALTQVEKNQNELESFLKDLSWE